MRPTILAGLSVLAAAPLCLTPAAAPDEVRTHDGRVLVGSVTRHGDVLVIETRTGTVEVPRAEVAGIRTESDLRAELDRLAAGRDGDAFAHLQLAETALAYGLNRDMWRHLERCLENVGDREELQRRLQGFLATLEPEVLPERYREADTKRRVLALVQRARDDRSAVRAAVLELLAREQGASETLRVAAKTEPLPEQRLMALAALQRRGDQGAESLIASRAVWDQDAAVRGRAVAMIREHGDAQAAVRRLGHGLMHDVPGIRIRTAQALAGLGGDEAAALLVVAGPFAGTPIQAAGGGGGPGVRASMYEITSQSYIRDFDVEIAQAAAVANPVIGTAQKGVVLDVNVPAVITQRVEIELAYRGALRNLVGSDPGRDPKSWPAWLQAARPEAAKLLPH